MPWGLLVAADSTPSVQRLFSLKKVSKEDCEARQLLEPVTTRELQLGVESHW